MRAKEELVAECLLICVTKRRPTAVFLSEKMKQMMSDGLIL